MQRKDIELTLDGPPPGGDIRELLLECQRRVDALLEEARDHPLSSFVPSDAGEVYIALEEVQRRGLANGNAFCEWGSGAGVATIIAARLEWDAVGIEIEERLVTASRRFAEAEGLDCEFALGTFVPRDHQDVLDEVAEFNWLAEGGSDAYQELDVDPGDVDLFYAYPWPGEEQVLFDLFERVASPGALLLTYHGMESFRLQRLVP